jgi:hypothetical protein
LYYLTKQVEKDIPYLDISVSYQVISQMMYRCSMEAPFLERQDMGDYSTLHLDTSSSKETSLYCCSTFHIHPKMSMKWHLLCS